MEATTPEAGFSNVDFLRRRFAAMGFIRTEAEVQAAAKAMDEEEARRLKQQAQAESPDEEIDDAWSQCSEDRETQDSGNDLDDVFQCIKEEYGSKEPVFGESQTQKANPVDSTSTPEAQARQSIAEAIKAEVAAAEASDPRELTTECPLYIINRKVANCRVLTSTERCCIGLLNSLMQKHGYAYVSNEQLAWWLGMKTNSVRNMLTKLTSQGFIKNTGRRHLEIRWVVCQEMQNAKRNVG